MKADTKRVWSAGYREGLRQGKARERARLRKIWNEHGPQQTLNDLSGGQRKKRSR